jgi:1,4-alpha-glucan branching enzyme
MFMHPGKKLLFMGCEIAQSREWNHDTSLDWHLVDYPSHLGMQSLVRDLNHLVAAEPALHQRDLSPDGFSWIDCNDHENSVVSFMRRAADPDDHLVVAVNFTPVVRGSYRIGVPRGGTYVEVLNTDAAVYSGSNVGNSGAVQAEAAPLHGHPYSVSLQMPPLGCVVLKPQR